MKTINVETLAQEKVRLYEENLKFATVNPFDLTRL